MAETDDLQAALLAGTMGIGKHGLARDIGDEIVDGTKWPRRKFVHGQANEDGSWSPKCKSLGYVMSEITPDAIERAPDRIAQHYITVQNRIIGIALESSDEAGMCRIAIGPTITTEEEEN
jgi:hypothetical protein